MRSFTGQLGTVLSGLGNVVPGLAPSAVIKAKKCFFPTSSWVHAFILTCNDKLAVWFKRGVHHIHHETVSGFPGVCCLYPQSNSHLYDLAVAWWSAGHFVHQFLYRILAYQLVAPPAVPCGSDCPPGVVVPCCTNTLPETLHATITSGGSLNGTYALAFELQSGIGQWQYLGALGTCPAGGQNLAVVCENTGAWHLTAGINLYPPTGPVCSPLLLVFTGVDLTACGGTSSATVTVTL